MSLYDEHPTEYHGADAITIIRVTDGRRIKISPQRWSYIQANQHAQCPDAPDFIPAPDEDTTVTEIRNANDQTIATVDTGHRHGCAFGRTQTCTCTYLAQWDRDDYTAPTFRAEPPSPSDSLILAGGWTGPDADQRAQWAKNAADFSAEPPTIPAPWEQVAASNTARENREAALTPITPEKKEEEEPKVYCIKHDRVGWHYQGYVTCEEWEKELDRVDAPRKTPTHDHALQRPIGSRNKEDAALTRDTITTAEHDRTHLQQLWAENDARLEKKDYYPQVNKDRLKRLTVNGEIWGPLNESPSWAQAMETVAERDRANRWRGTAILMFAFALSVSAISLGRELGWW